MAFLASTSPKHSMPSGQLRPDVADQAFFLDRALGRHTVADALRVLGHIAMPMADVYPNGQDQQVPDEQWIAEVSARGWIALTKDAAIIRDHSDALAMSTLRVFALNNANLSGTDMAARYVEHLPEILARAQEAGPYVYVVTSSGLERRWPK